MIEIMDLFSYARVINNDSSISCFIWFLLFVFFSAHKARAEDKKVILCFVFCFSHKERADKTKVTFVFCFLSLPQGTA